MSEFKGTSGKWSYSKQKGIKNHCFQAQVWNENGGSMAIIEPTDNEHEASANALLISKAPDLLQEIIDFVETTEEEGVANLDYFIPRFKQLIKQATEI